MLHTASVPLSSSSPRWSFLVTAAVVGSLTATALFLSPPAKAKAQSNTTQQQQQENNADDDSLEDKSKDGQLPGPPCPPSPPPPLSGSLSAVR